MDERRRTFQTFLALNACKACTSETPVAYLQFCHDGVTPPPPDEPLIALSAEDVMEELDSEAELVRWLLHQMTTYEPSRQRIVGLVFDRTTVLSEVLRTVS